MHSPNNPAGILIIEDDDDIRELLAELLTIHGHRAVGARSARDGLALLVSGFRPRVLVLDPFIRDNASLYLAELIDDPAWENTPVIIGRGSAASVRGADGLLQCHFLRKPLDLCELFDALARYLVARNRLDGARPRALRIPSWNTATRSGGGRRQGRADLVLFEGRHPPSSRLGHPPWNGSGFGRSRYARLRKARA
jgi:DNA-binding NtrC family response regulator